VFDADPELGELINEERHRQTVGIEMIASEVDSQLFGGNSNRTLHRLL